MFQSCTPLVLVLISECVNPDQNVVSITYITCKKADISPEILLLVSYIFEFYDILRIHYLSLVRTHNSANKSNFDFEIFFSLLNGDREACCEYRSRSVPIQCSKRRWVLLSCLYALCIVSTQLASLDLGRPLFPAL
jgi:hypothetical protein